MSRAIYADIDDRRSREGAWIEMAARPDGSMVVEVAPVRERGLKSNHFTDKKYITYCRSREGAWIEIAVQRYWQDMERASLP